MTAIADSKTLTAPMSRGLTFAMAIAAGVAVANIYYNQPMLGTLAVQFHVSPAEIGWLPTLTQLGYAIGILLLSPIGVRFDRRRVIIAKMFLLGWRCWPSLQRVHYCNCVRGASLSVLQRRLRRIAFQPLLHWRPRLSAARSWVA